MSTLPERFAEKLTSIFSAIKIYGDKLDHDQVEKSLARFIQEERKRELLLLAEEVEKRKLDLQEYTLGGGTYEEKVGFNAAVEENAALIRKRAELN